MLPIVSMTKDDIYLLSIFFVILIEEKDPDPFYHEKDKRSFVALSMTERIQL
jgi:hypothetical protein